MATYEELQADLEEAQRELNDVRRARKVGSNYRLLNGETITAEEYAVLQSDAKIALNNAKKAAKGPDESRKRIGELEKEINRLQKLVSAGRADQMTLANARVDINRYQQQLTDEQQKLESFGTAPRPGSAAGMTLRADVAAAERAVQPAPTPSEEKPKPPVGGTGGGTGGKGGKGDTKPEKPKGVAPLDIAAVEATSKEMFPAQAWLWDIDPAKYPQLRALLVKGVQDRMFETTVGQERFAASLDGTDFFRELSQKKTASTIRSLVGDLGFAGDQFNKFLVTAANMGWSNDTLKQEVYKEAFRRDETGAYVNPTAISRVQKSNDYLSVQNIGKAYFASVDDNTVQSVLTGAMTSDDVARQQRELAKTKYGHLSNLIDQGFTMESLTSSFRQQAARLLERDENSINMSETDFEQSFNFGEEGKKRMMTSGEWEMSLRSNEKFGWQNTQNAKDEARRLATSIAQAFGRVI
jgi:hypothetical protein